MPVMGEFVIGPLYHTPSTYKRRTADLQIRHYGMICGNGLFDELRGFCNIEFKLYYLTVSHLKLHRDRRELP